jgi:plasmid stability protein
MAKTLTIKKVPDEVVRRLRQRAARNHRSLQGELLATIEGSVLDNKKLSIAQFRKENALLGFHTPSESTRIIREARDARAGR